MSLTYTEVASSGISEDKFDEIFNSEANFLKQIIIQRHTPNFLFHDSSSNVGSEPFTIAADETKIVRVVNSAGSIYVDYLLLENVDPTSPSSWSSPELISSTGNLTLTPKVVRESDHWDVIVPDIDGTIQRYSSADATGSWTNAQFGTFELPTDGTVRLFTYGPGIETCYYWVWASDTSTYNLRTCDSSVSGLDEDTDIYWHDAPIAIDCVLYTDNSDDPDGHYTQSDVRHALVMSIPLPALYVFQNVDGQPKKEIVPSGGVISFVVRPPTDTATYGYNRIAQFSLQNEIQTFDKETSLQYRRTCHITGMSSTFDAANPTDTLWTACIGGDGDINGDDTSYGYTALYYYSSRDNIHWSQDRMALIDGIASFSDFVSGVCLVRCGDYIYLVGAKTTLRSLASSQFGEVHADWKLDISEWVTGYSSSRGDTRQSRVTVDNQNNHFKDSLLLSEPVSLSLITKVGRHTSEGNYLFQVSIEDIDSVSLPRNRPTHELEIQARDRMCWLTDRSQSADSVIYDHLMTGSDTYSPIGGSDNSGLRHSAVVAGTFGTESNTLKLKSNYKEGIVFTTFESMIDNGSIEETFTLMKPESHALPGETVTNGNNHCYAGFVFHAVDKDNFWYAKYDYWAQGFSIGYRKNGNDHPEYFIAADGWFISQANNELPFTFRIEYRFSRLFIYSLNSSGVLILSSSVVLRGRSAITAPLQQGYAGLLGCGFSDEDTGEVEPEPIILITDGPPSDAIPSRLLMLTLDGRLIRATQTDTLTGIPNFTQVAGPSNWRPTLHVDNDARAICNDPYEPDTVFVMGKVDIRKITDVWGVSPVVTTVWDIADPIGGVYADLTRGNVMGSINRQGYFGWMVMDHNGGDNTYYVYTTDGFETFHITYLQSDWGYSVGSSSWVPGLFNTNSHGRIYVSPGTGDVLTSTNWGASFGLMYYNGNDTELNIFYKKPDGNDNTIDDFMSSRSSNRLVLAHANGTITELGVATPYNVYAVPRNLHRFSVSTDNGNYQAIIQGVDLQITDDAWVTKTTQTVPGGGSYEGVTGFPSNPNYYVTWNGNNIQMTFNRGSSWGDLGSSYRTWATANLGSAPDIIYVYADLAEWYDVPKWNG